MALESKTFDEYLLNRYALEVHSVFLGWATQGPEYRGRHRLDLLRNIIKADEVAFILNDLGFREQSKTILGRKVSEFQERFSNIPPNEFNMSEIESWAYQTELVPQV